MKHAEMKGEMTTLKKLIKGGPSGSCVDVDIYCNSCVYNKKDGGCWVIIHASGDTWYKNLLHRMKELKIARLKEILQ